MQRKLRTMQGLIWSEGVFGVRKLTGEEARTRVRRKMIWSEGKGEEEEEEELKDSIGHLRLRWYPRGPTYAERQY